MESKIGDRISRKLYKLSVKLMSRGMEHLHEFPAIGSLFQVVLVFFLFIVLNLQMQILLKDKQIILFEYNSIKNIYSSK